MKSNTLFAKRYKLKQRIGVGGFSEVWSATDQMADDSLIALKIYAPERGMDERGLKQFRREYAVVLNLRHSNLLTARHFDIYEGRPYLVMPLIAGGSLYDKLDREGPFSEIQVAELIRQVCAGLTHLHTRKIMHQDIKPDNILIEDQETYLLTDFGISSRIRSTLRKQTGMARAMTVAYAPPERFTATPLQVPAGDVFSLGVVVYEVITGDVPWMGNGGISLHTGASIPKLPEGYSAAFQSLLASMMAVNPEERPKPAVLVEAAVQYQQTGSWPDTETVQKSASTTRPAKERKTQVLDRGSQSKEGRRKTKPIDYGQLSSPVPEADVEKTKLELSKNKFLYTTLLVICLIAISLLYHAFGSRFSETEIVNVTNPATGQTWMDRNLGASRAANSPNDEEAYGDLYQWGRAADGHEKRNSSTTTTLSSSDQPGHGDFILEPDSPRDWRSPQNDDLWQGVNRINNPCPDGYRLPTEVEWEAERKSWNSNNASGAFNSPLKLPVPGTRDNSSGFLLNVGSFGFYWSGSISGSNARDLHFSSESANVISNSRAFGLSVRCIKD